MFIHDTSEGAIDYLDINILQSAGFASALLVPLVSHGRAVGTLNVVSRKPRAFNEEHAATLLPVAEIFAVAPRRPAAPGDRRAAPDDGKPGGPGGGNVHRDQQCPAVDLRTLRSDRSRLSGSEPAERPRRHRRAGAAHFIATRPDPHCLTVPGKQHQRFFVVQGFSLPALKGWTTKSAGLKPCATAVGLQGCRLAPCRRVPHR